MKHREGKSGYRLLDLFCGAGGCSMGYYLAGFEVLGVDIHPQPKYPFQFVQSCAIEYATLHCREFDAIHASPPCQAFSISAAQWRNKGRSYPDYINPVRKILSAYGAPYIIENVIGSPLLDPITLCGTMFGLRIYRHRLFESNISIPQPIHPPHIFHSVDIGRYPSKDQFIQPVGHFSGVHIARKSMRISWMAQKELSQAIPPAYTKYIGQHVIRYLRSRSKHGSGLRSKQRGEDKEKVE